MHRGGALGAPVVLTAAIAQRAADIEFTAGREKLRGYVAVPEGRAPFAGVVLIPDVRGLYDHYREIARRFADEGFATLALDIYSREGAPELPELESVFRWMKALPDDRVLADVRAAVEYLASFDDVRSDAIAVTGFCMGGQYALMAACAVPGIAACASWYGMLRYAETNELKPRSPLEMAHELACPYLGIFGEEDALIPMSDVEQLRTILARSRYDTETITYPRAGHAFFNDTRPEMYRPEAASDSWTKVVGFLRKQL